MSICGWCGLTLYGWRDVVCCGLTPSAVAWHCLQWPDILRSPGFNQWHVMVFVARNRNISVHMSVQWRAVVKLHVLPWDGCVCGAMRSWCLRWCRSWRNAMLQSGNVFVTFWPRSPISHKKTSICGWITASSLEIRTRCSCRPLAGISWQKYSKQRHAQDAKRYEHDSNKAQSKLSRQPQQILCCCHFPVFGARFGSSCWRRCYSNTMLYKSAFMITRYVFTHMTVLSAIPSKNDIMGSDLCLLVVWQVKWFVQWLRHWEQTYTRQQREAERPARMPSDHVIEGQLLCELLSHDSKRKTRSASWCCLLV